MDPSKKLEFVHRMTKLALEKVPHFAAGGATNPNTGIIGTIGGALGLNNNFQAGSANTTAGTNAGQLQGALTQAQTGLIGLQSIADTTAGGVGAGTAREETLANQLATEAAGGGPNPAQASLNQNTGNNIAATAALLAGQRGAGANPGLAAINAAEQGASTEQQAIGQAATLQAQQQLAAQNNLANLSANQVSQGLGAASTSANAAQNEQNILQQANTAFNNAQVGMQSNINNVNSQTAAANQNMAANIFGGIAGGASSALSAVSSLFAKGGLVRMDKGGRVLDAEHRNRLPKDSFALPGRRYPIHDEAHARNALARVSQYGTTAEKAKVRSAVHKKYPQIGAKKMAEGGIAAEPLPGASPVSATDESSLNIPATASLPADQTNFAGSSGGSGGGKSGGGIGGLLALLAEGGEVQQTPEQRESQKDTEAAADAAYDKLHGKTSTAQQPPTLDPRTWWARGGPVTKMYARSGLSASVSAPSLSGGVNGPQSFAGQWVNTPAESLGGVNVPSTPSLSTGNGGANLKSGITAGLNSLAPKGAPITTGTATDDEMAGGPGDTMSNSPSASPNEMIAAKGGSVRAGSDSQKAVTQKDSLKNDKIPAMLSEGEGVIDRETMNDPGTLGQMARALIKHIEAKKKGGSRAAQAK